MSERNRILSTNSQGKKKLTRKAIGARAGAVVVLLTLVMGCVIYVHSDDYTLAHQLDLGYKYLAELDYEQAVIAFQQAIQIDPMNVDAYLGLTETYIGIGKFDEAVTVLVDSYDLTGDERLLDANENVIAAWLEKAQDADYGVAILEFRKVIEIDPMNTDAYIGLAKAYVNMRNFGWAIQILNQGYEKTCDKRLLDEIDAIIAA